MTNFNAALGLQHEADGTIVLETKPEHEIVSGMIHVAVLTTMAEVAAAAAVGDAVVPASLTMSLLERAAAGRLTSKGRVLRKGKRMAVAEGEVFSNGILVAKGVVTFAVL